MWLGTRAALLALGISQVGSAGSLGIVTLATALATADSRYLGERLFLANLGVPFSHLLILSAALPLVFEFALSFLI